MQHAAHTAAQILGVAGDEPKLCMLRSDNCRRGPARLSRLETVKQLFHAFVNRSEAYGYAHAIGLICFGATARMTCQLTPLFERFRDHVDSAKASGDTCLYDAIVAAAAALRAYAQTRPGCLLRVVCLSDGADTCSRTTAYQVCCDPTHPTAPPPGLPLS